MPKKEIFLEKKIIDRLREIADSKNISVEKIIKEAIKECIADYNTEKDDPLLNLIGIGESEDAGGSEKPDENLYGGESNG